MSWHKWLKISYLKCFQGAIFVLRVVIETALWENSPVPASNRAEKGVKNDNQVHLSSTKSFKFSIKLNLSLPSKRWNKTPILSLWFNMWFSVIKRIPISCNKLHVCYITVNCRQISSMRYMYLVWANANTRKSSAATACAPMWAKRHMYNMHVWTLCAHEHKKGLCVCLCVCCVCVWATARRKLWLISHESSGNSFSRVPVQGLWWNVKYNKAHQTLCAFTYSMCMGVYMLVSLLHVLHRV